MGKFISTCCISPRCLEQGAVVSLFGETAQVLPLKMVVSSLAWALAFSLPLPHAFHCALLLLLSITCRGQRGPRLLGSSPITQRIRWYQDLTSMDHITQKDQMAQHDSVMSIHHAEACTQTARSHLGSFGRALPFHPQRSLASEVL